MTSICTMYSDRKLAWLPGDYLETLRKGDLCPPVYLQIHPTGSCQLRCNWCAFGGLIPRLKRPATALSWDTVRDALSDFAALKGRAVEITGGGEPMCHPQILEILVFARMLDLEVGLVTNGAALDADKETEFLRYAPQLTWIRVSLDAPTREAWRTLKGRDLFYRLEDFTGKIANAVKHSTCLVSLSYIVSSETTDQDIKMAVSWARRFGLPIRFGPVYSGDRPLLVTESVRHALNLYSSLPGVLDMTGQRYQDAAEAYCHPDRPCGYMHVAAVLGCDGRLYPCCSTTYSEEHVIGNLKEIRFKDWWYSKEHKQVVKRWNRIRRCQGIACSQRIKNEAFHALVIDSPQHPNFI